MTGPRDELNGEVLVRGGGGAGRFLSDPNSHRLELITRLERRCLAITLTLTWSRDRY